MTPGTEPALTPDEWLGGMNRGKQTALPAVWPTPDPLHILLLKLLLTLSQLSSMV